MLQYPAELFAYGLLLTFQLGCMPAVSLSPHPSPITCLRWIGHNVWFGDAGTCLMSGYRLMSDYEVTLVNDNSTDPSSYTILSLC